MFGIGKKENYELTITVLRFAIGSVFLWFGIDKWLHPAAWFGWVDIWPWPLGLLDHAWLLFLIGLFEFAIGICLVAGKLTRAASATAALALIVVFIFAGASEATLRDAAVVGGCLALFVNANAAAKRPVSSSWLRLAATAYVIWLLVAGLLFLRQGPV